MTTPSRAGVCPAIRDPGGDNNHGPFDGELGDYYRAISADVPISRSAARGLRHRHTCAAVIHHGVDVDAFRSGTVTAATHCFSAACVPTKAYTRPQASPVPPGSPFGSLPRCVNRPRAVLRVTGCAVARGRDRIPGRVGSGEKLDLLAHAKC